MSYIIYEIENDSVRELPIRKEYQQTFWSIDEQRIWYKTNYGIYSSTSGGDDVRYHIGTYCIPFGNMKCIKFHEIGNNIPRGMYRLHNFADQTDTLISAPALDQFREVLNCDISPQHTMIAGDFWEYGGDKFNGKNCLGIFDLRTNIFRRVLPSQALGSLYYPIWTYRGTLMVSFVCRNDSAYTIWEIDTNGVFLRQWIGKSDMEALLELRAVDQAPLNASIETVFPNPARTHVTIQYVCNAISPARVTIIDLRGREYTRVETIPGDIGKANTLVLPIGQLGPGFYLVALSISGRRPVYRSMIIE